MARKRDATARTRVVANGDRLPIKLEPGCALLLRTTDGKLVEKAMAAYAADERRGSVARAGAVLQFNYKAVEAARVALGAYRACLRVRHKSLGRGGDLPSAGFAAALALSRVCGKTRLFGFGSPPPGATYSTSGSSGGSADVGKKKDADGGPIGYQYFVERNQDGSLNVGSPAHNFELEFVSLQSLARNVKSVTMCGPGLEGRGDCKAPAKPSPKT